MSVRGSAGRLAALLVAGAACFVDAGLPDTGGGATTDATTTGGAVTTVPGTTTAAVTSDAATSDAATTEVATAAGTTTSCEAKTWFHDQDGDGYGDSMMVQLACSQPDDAAAQGGDCDDTRKDVSPGAPELCDQADNNCDGVIDEYGPSNNMACNGCRRFVTPTTFYDLCDQTLLWADARTACQMRGGDLAAFETPDEHAAVLVLVQPASSEAWIGLSDAVMQGTFVWVTGASLDWQAPWAMGEPSGGPDEDCVRVIWTMSAWKDSYCTSSYYPSVCEIPR